MNRERKTPRPGIFGGPPFLFPKYVMSTPQVGEEFTPTMQSGGPLARVI